MERTTRGALGRRARFAAVGVVWLGLAAFACPPGVGAQAPGAGGGAALDRLDAPDAIVGAAQESNVEMVRLLLARKPSQALKDEALLAVSSFAIPIIEIRGLPPAPPQPAEPGPIRDAVGTVRLLLANGARIEARDESGSTPLILAAAFALTDVARALLDAGANLEARDARGGTALTAAACSCAQASMNDTRPVIRLLLSRGARINGKGPGDWTPLMAAAGWRAVHTAGLLLERGARVDQRDDKGQTALMVAIDASDGDVEFVALLLKHGADPDAKDRQGRTAIDRASAQGHAAVVDLLTRARKQRGR